MEWSQEGIVTGLRQQDPAAVRDWVTRYTPSIRRVGMSYLNNNDQATKLTKAVFSQALATIQTGFTPTDMEGWLVGMAKMRASQQVLATSRYPTKRCIRCRGLRLYPAMHLYIRIAPPMCWKLPLPWRNLCQPARKCSRSPCPL